MYRNISEYYNEPNLLCGSLRCVFDKVINVWMIYVGLQIATVILEVGRYKIQDGGSTRSKTSQK